MLAHTVINCSLPPNDIREVNGRPFTSCRAEAHPADIEGPLINVHGALIVIFLGHDDCRLVTQGLGNGKLWLSIQRYVHSNAFAVAEYGFLICMEKVVHGPKIKVARGYFVGVLSAKLNLNYKAILEATQGFSVVALGP